MCKLISGKIVPKKEDFIPSQNWDFIKKIKIRLNFFYKKK